MKYKVFVLTTIGSDLGILPNNLGSQFRDERYQTSENDSYIWNDFQLPDLLGWLVSQGCSGLIDIRKV